MKKRGIVKATGLYTVGNIFNRAISLLLLPVFTRLLSTSSYGIVSTYNSWVTITTVIVGLQLYLSLRSACTDYRDNLNSYISSIDALIIFNFFILTAVIVPLCLLFKINIPILLVILCLVQSLMNSMINVELQRGMMALDYVKRTVLLILPNLVGAILGIILIICVPKTDYLGRIGTNVFTYVIFGTVILITHFKKGRLVYNKEYWKYGIVISFPLIFHGLASDILSSVDRTMISVFRSTSETGFYSVAYTLGMAIKVITSSFESVWIPWFTENINNHTDKREINRVAQIYILIVSLLCVSAMLCLPEVFKIFTQQSYWEGIYLIAPIVLASFITFLYSLSVDVEYYHKATKSIAVNSMVAGGINLLLNWIFIPLYGAVAAAYTTVASYAVSFGIHYYNSRKLDSELFPFSLYIVPLLIVIVGTLLSYLILDTWIFRWLIAGAALFITLVLVMKKTNFNIKAFFMK